MSLRFSLVLTTSFWLLSNASEALAADGPLPTYDYDPQTPGIQSPISSVLQGHESRVFRTFQLNVSVFVPLAELQAILPDGFTAIPNPSGSNTALIGLGLIHQQRSERVGGVDGPESTFVVSATVRNSLLQRNEAVLLANEKSNPASVANSNALFGETTARLAQVETEVEEKSGLLHLRFDVNDDELGLRLVVEAVGPAAIVTRVTQDPIPTPFRAVSGRTTQKSFRLATQFDSNAVTVTQDNLRVLTPDQLLRLPGGNLTMVQVGTTMTFQRWREQFVKLEPNQ